MDNYDVKYKDGKWKFQKQGSEAAIKMADTKAELMNFMKKFMSDKRGSVKIHKKNGKYQEERTYPRKADPRKSKG